MTKVLLVEDDKSLREIYGVRLQAEGYDIVSAGDGEEALAMAIKEKPVLIISDVMMPKISGFDMLDILRSTTETRDIKVIMMTALSSDDQRNRGEQLGADRYLVKSQVGIEDVVRTVHEVLSDGAGGAPVAAAPAPAAEPVTEPATLPVAEPATTPVDPTPAVDAPQVQAAQPDATLPATEPTATPEPVAPVSAPEPVFAPEPTPTAIASPGNDAAGPLPPQPVLEQSSLPEPTAPFSSPRPANLGERLIQPLETSGQPTVTQEEITNELNAPVEPVTPVVGEPSTPAIPSAPSIDLAAAGAPPTSADDVLPQSPAAPVQSPPQAPTPPTNPAV